MEHLGKITDWRDERGFGFITPLQDGAERVFFHIRDYRQSGRRPEQGELVKYVINLQGRRAKATAVERAVGSSKSARQDSRRPVKSWRIPAAAQYALIAVYICSLSWAIVDRRLPVEFVFLVSGMSSIAYMAYALDKHAAQQGRSRIPETTLHLMELLSGWPGALLAQLMLRHKTSKRSYRIGFWFVTFVNVMATVFWVARP